MRNTDEWYSGLAALKFFAAVGIVGCYLALSPMTRPASYLVELADSNVGLFAALSGFFLARSLARSYLSSLDIVKSRVVRLGSVYVFWSCFYLTIKFALDLSAKGTISPRFAQIDAWVRIVLAGDSAAHLWYLAFLIYAVVIVVCLRSWIGWWGWLVLSCALFLNIAFCNGGWWINAYPIRLLAYLCLGLGMYHIRGYLVSITKPICFFVLLAGLGVHGLRLDPCVRYIANMLIVIPLIIMSLSYNKTLSRKLEWMYGCSFGIYLLHVSVAFAVGIIVRHIASTPYTLAWVMLEWAVVASMSFFGVLILRRWRCISLALS